MDLHCQFFNMIDNCWDRSCSHSSKKTLHMSDSTVLIIIWYIKRKRLINKYSQHPSHPSFQFQVMLSFQLPQISIDQYNKYEKSNDNLRNVSSSFTNHRHQLSIWMFLTSMMTFIKNKKREIRDKQTILSTNRLKTITEWHSIIDKLLNC